MPSSFCDLISPILCSMCWKRVPLEEPPTFLLSLILCLPDSDAIKVHTKGAVDNWWGQAQPHLNLG